MDDVLALQKKYLEEWEALTGQYIEQTMRDPQYLAAVGTMWQIGNFWLDLSRACVEPWLETIDVPSHQSLSGLYQSVHDLEMRLLDLEGRVEDELIPTVAGNR